MSSTNPFESHNDNQSNNPFQQHQQTGGSDPYNNQHQQQAGGNPYQQPNPWQDQSSTQQSQQYQAPPGPPPHSGGEGGGETYAAPPGPPPSQQQPTRAKTFEAADFVPEGELGQQREMMQQFESDHQQQASGMGAGGGESRTDRDVAALQQEFPGIDGSVVAAIYGDSGDLGATREVLQELSSGGGGN